MSDTTGIVTDALRDVLAERARQEAKWGEQNHPMVDVTDEARRLGAEAVLTARRHGVSSADAAKLLVDGLARQGRVTYVDIFNEEVAEFVEACAVSGETSDAARTEMVQVAAVALAMVECIDRKRAKGGG